MPKPTEGESKADFIKRCIPYMIHEGKTPDEAKGACYGIWESNDRDGGGDMPTGGGDGGGGRGDIDTPIITFFEPPEAGDLPASGKKVLAEVYSSCRSAWVKDHPDDKENKANKEKCAKIAWSAVHKAGYSNDYQLIEPRPVKGETIDQWLIRCPPIFEADGQSPIQARGRCCIIWDEWVGEPDYPEQPRKPEQPSGPPSDDQNPKYSGEGTRQLYTFDMDCDHALEFINEPTNLDNKDTQKDPNKYNAVALKGDEFYKKKFLGFKEIELARQTMDRAYHDYNHWGTSYPPDGHPNIEYIIGHQTNTKTNSTTKQLITDIIIEPTAKNYPTWKGFMNICKAAGRTPNVSVSFWADNKTMKARDLPPGTNYNLEGYKEDSDVPILTNLSFQALSTVFKGACDDKQGCGIQQNQDDMKIKREQFELKKGIEKQKLRLKNRGKEENNG